MSLNLYLQPKAGEFERNTGIGQVVDAQHRLLEKFDVHIVDRLDKADVIAAHISKQNLERVDIIHSHGLYFEDIPHINYDKWHRRINKDIIESVKEAYLTTVPSEWVAMPFKRDMRISPRVIGHGINLSEWSSGENRGYVLYNKNRESDVCMSFPAWKLANAGIDVVSTYAPPEAIKPNTMKVIGIQPFDKMKKLIASADIYLATTIETFGIGTIEALACGVPVLGFDWGGTADIVNHKENGYLVPPNDFGALIEGYQYIRKNRKKLSENALESAKGYDWENVIAKYAEVYRDVLAMKNIRNDGVSVVITNYNYGKYVSEAIESVLAQEKPAKEIIVVDDHSSDDSKDILTNKFGEDSRVKLLFHSTNKGVAAARTTGIQEATQQFVICLDADDRIRPEYIAEVLPKIKEDRSIGIAYSGLEIINAKGVGQYVSDFPPDFDWDIQSMVHNPPANCIPSCSMFRREMWERAGTWKQVYHPAEDCEFWVRGLSVGFNAKKVTKKALFQYRVHGKGASQTKKYRQIDYWLPFMRDKRFPMGAPSKGDRIVNSYLEPMVSVIIPVGDGHEHYMVGAVESVIGQTFREWELILINDTDPKNKEFDKYTKSYPFAKIINLREQKKHGAGAGRNAGIETAKAPFVLFLDADDYLLPTAIEDMMTKMIEVGGNRYVYTDWLSVRGSEIKAQEAHDYKQNEWIMQHSTTVLMPTECAKKIKFDESLITWEDYDFFLRCAINGVCGVRLNKSLFAYRLESGTRRTQAVTSHTDAKDIKLTPEGASILESFRKKYKDYFTGAKKMAGCGGCGSRAGASIIKAKSLISGNMASADFQKEQEIIKMATSKTGMIRLEFIGTNYGAVTFRGVVGSRVYRGGLNPNNRFVDVHPDDVSKLVGTGRWRYVQTHLPEALLVQSDVPAKVDVEKTKPAIKKVVTEGEVKASAAQPVMKAREGLLDPNRDVDESLRMINSNQPIETPTGEETASKEPKKKKNKKATDGLDKIDWLEDS